MHFIRMRCNYKLSFQFWMGWGSNQI
jgi:hypothetical protein